MKRFPMWIAGLRNTRFRVELEDDMLMANMDAA